jgi:IS5 family transposase
VATFSGLRSDETEAYADVGYTGVAKRPEFQGSDFVWYLAEKRGKLKKIEEGPRKSLVAQRERVKAQIRSTWRRSVPASQGALSGTTKEHGAAVYAV